MCRDTITSLLTLILMTLIGLPSLQAADLVDAAVATEQPLLAQQSDPIDLNRDPNLEQFLIDHPEHPLSHWVNGEVWTGESWLQHSLVIEQGDRWHEVYRYQQERATRQDNFRDNLFLADGCREHQLNQEERAHLSRVLMHDYSFHEAHRRLGHINVNQFWITPRQRQLAYRERLYAAYAMSEWHDEIVRLRKKFSKAKPHSKAEQFVAEEIFQIRHPDAIIAMEYLFAPQGLRETIVYQDWLSRLESFKAGEALVRQSVYPEAAELRVRAAKLLKDRRTDEYVPYALGGLTTRKTRYDITSTLLPVPRILIPASQLRKQTVVDSFDATLTVNSSRVVLKPESMSRSLWNRIDLVGPSDHPAQLPQVANQANAGLGDIFLTDYLTQINELPQQVYQNRVMRMLQTVTDEDHEETEEWFNWWRKQNDLVIQGGKLQLNDEYDDGIWYTDNRRVQRVDRVVAQSGSCFVAGTIVETEHGPRPIEEIMIGDLVLSQDHLTGELTFKPVLETTVRKSASTVVVKTSQGNLHCSIGHPFWISGLGWRMAKELEPGMPLYTLHGESIDITEIIPEKKQTVHNLVVADFSSYFAGEKKFYTHDVTPRLAHDMALPGIRKKFE